MNKNKIQEWKQVYQSEVRYDSFDSAILNE